ncbi:hypothetical protein Tco_1150899 [Tanacetum coccineum]
MNDTKNRTRIMDEFNTANRLFLEWDLDKYLPILLQNASGYQGIVFMKYGRIGLSILERLSFEVSGEDTPYFFLMDLRGFI